MRTVAKLTCTAFLMVALSGCSLAPYLEEHDPSLDRTIQAAEPSEEPSPTTTPDFTCKDVPAAVLHDVERIGNVGGGVRFRNAQMVPAGDQWWAVAVRVWVDPYSDIDPDSYGGGTVQVYITNAPSHPDRLLGSTDRSAPFASQAKDAARRCVEKLG
ncbi:hypothetical protein ATK74_2826 [Propionicimonas paludicola]|uniref:Lipoprotein n=1 Tax=Propionicimonas paludicola TaxID=185243 RepID=A0A2A9CX49_9ACTN|nr:hypothetical protein [Propionicimonas paludicola]PFG18242.1 hypothetical protein ATK74_2826 [Propionicimonas paludicola]